MRRTMKKQAASLTAREQEILELIWNGLKNREMGKQLQISVKTVEAHRANMMRKLRVTNAALLLKTGFELGFLRLRRRAA
jgi:DNA-binding NarL/FixJ family response regulator